MANQVLYGFLNMEGEFDQHISDSNVTEVTTAIDASVAEHNRQMNALMGLFVQPTTEYKVRYAQIGASRSQPLDENGRARPIVPSGFYDVGFPIRDSGNAWGATFKAREKLTVGDANRITATMLNGDKVWMRDQMLAALFATTAYNYIDPKYGTIAVEPLANGDAVTYQRAGSLTSSADTHQLGFANAIGAGADDPYPDIHDELVEHPENDGEVLALIATDQRATTEALTGFHQVTDPNIALGISSDRLVGSLGTAVPGEVIGYHDSGVWIAEWSSLPNGYIIGCMTAGSPALAMRQEPEAALQGFIRVPDQRIDHPFYETQYVRFAGFGGWNRVGAVAVEIGDASYDVPTGYTPPIS